MTIVVGSSDPTKPPSHKSKRKFIERKKIKNVKLHPLFENPAAKFDLALVEIEGQFSFRDSRSPICIPEKVRNLAIFLIVLFKIPNLNLQLISQTEIWAIDNLNFHKGP